jgi:hypothetical protein
MTQAQRDAIAAPAAGLAVFNTTTNNLNVWDGAQWQQYLTAQGGPTVGFTAPGTYSYTVPQGVASLDATVSGAAGGDGTLTFGGSGGRVQAFLKVTPGQVLVIVVGGAGRLGVAGSNGGGQPNADTGGGGGASDIRRSGGSLADRLLVAGGGGGGANGGLAGANRYQDPNAFGTGGTGGSSVGQQGGSEAYRSDTRMTTYPYVAEGGDGGTQSRGGAGGNSNAGGPSGTAGALGRGANASTRGGAGGGGYYGGGSGATMYNSSLSVFGGGGGGGGGSSFADPNLTTNVVHTQGGSASGSVVIRPLSAPQLDGSNIVNTPGDNLGNHSATQPLNLNANWVLNAGRVGIGTMGPAVPLDVQSTSSLGTYSFAYYARSADGSAPLTGVGANSNSDVSIRAAGRVVATEFNATSDARLKRVLGLSDNAADLALLLRLRITDYQLRDRALAGERRFKKVIAQDVEAVFPQAVSRHSGFLPDLYAPAQAVRRLPGDSLLALSLATGLPAAAAAGQRLKLVGPGGEVVATLARAAAPGSRALVLRGAAALAAAPGEVFVFGFEHADVRAVDYEALAMLNVSATQALARQLRALQQQAADAAAKAQAAEAKAAAANTQAAAAEATTQRFELRLRELETRFSTSQR